MDCVCKIVGCIGGPIAQFLMPFVSTEIGYVWNYDDNIRLLNDELRKLRDLRVDVEERVKTGSDKGEIVKDNVKEWWKKANELEQEVDNFVKDFEARENQGWCTPDICTKYRLGEKAKKKKDSVLGLKNSGIFETVTRPRPPPKFEASSSNDYVHFQSRARVFREIMEALKDDEIKMIGVYGMGGVGKTRMVKEVGEQALKDELFDKVVFTKISQTLDVIKVQGQLASQLGPKLDGVTVPERASELGNRLKNAKKTLIIIDDVWKKINLKEIGIILGDGCKIVLTTRKQDVCTKMNVQPVFAIGVLSESEAWALFKTKVENSETIITFPQEMRSVAEEVCRKCGGLPLALLVFGEFLKNTRKHVWLVVSDNLRNSRRNIDMTDLEEGLYCKLQLSYDYLRPTNAHCLRQPTNTQKCFLLCCLFPEDAEISIEDLVTYAMRMRLFEDVGTIENGRNIVETLVDILKTSCLLLGVETDLVKMHHVIRVVAISIALEEEQVGVHISRAFKAWRQLTPCSNLAPAHQTLKRASSSSSSSSPNS